MPFATRVAHTDEGFEVEVVIVADTTSTGYSTHPSLMSALVRREDAPTDGDARNLVLAEFSRRLARVLAAESGDPAGAAHNS